MTRFEIVRDDVKPTLALLGAGLSDFTTFNERVLEDGLSQQARNFEESAFFGDPWPLLRPSTLKRKARQGLPLDPLIATGGLLSEAVTGADRQVSAFEASTQFDIERRGFNVAAIHQKGAPAARIEPRPFAGWDEGRIPIYEGWLFEHLGLEQ